MATGPERLVRYIQRLVVHPEADGTTDADLLERFISARDEKAFAALVDRHGPLVLQVCRRVLGDVHDVEDAFQATFLILARKAASLYCRETLPAWLHGVARRVALKALSAKARRFREARPLAGTAADPHPDPASELSARELLAIVDEEIQRLPEVCRLPVILCCLERHSLEEAARRLGWTRGSVKGHLERGRARLHQRLVRRGLTLSAALAAAEVSRSTVTAALVARLGMATTQAAVAFASQSTETIPVSAGAAALAEEVARGMTLAPLKLGGVLLLATGIVASGLFMFKPAPEAPPGQPAQPRQAGFPQPEARIVQAMPAKQDGPTRTDRYGDPLPPGALARVGTVRFRQGSQVYCLAFSPDGRFIASGSFHGDLCLWDRATGQLVRRLADPSPADPLPMVTSIAFSPDGKLVASNKGSGGIWEARSGKLLRRLDQSFTRSVHSVYSVTFSSDGKALAVGTEKGIWLCDPATGQASRPIGGHPGIVPAVVFSRDGKVLASGSPDSTARILDAASGAEIRRFEPQDKVVDVALSTGGKWLAAQTRKEVLVWEATTGREFRRFSAERHLRSLAFSPDETRLASANRVWDVTTGKEVCRLEGVPNSGLAWKDGKTLVQVTGSFGPTVSGALAFAPDGKMLATGGYDGVIRLHDPDSGKEIPQAANPFWNRGRMVVCGFDPSGRWLATQDQGGIHLCATSSGREIHRLSIKDDNELSLAYSPVALAPDGRTVVAAGLEAIYQWDTATGQKLRRIPHRRKQEDVRPMAALAFAPDGRTFACAHYEPTIRLWDTATGKECGQFAGHESGIGQLFFLPDGKQLASVSFNGTIQVWDVARRKELRRWSLSASGILAFTPDGKTVAVGGAENPLLVLCDLVSGEAFRRFDGLQANCCAFSPDGRILAVDTDPYYSPDRARTIQLVEVASGQVRARFAGHFGFPEQMLFSPDGKLLATGSSDATVLIWDVTGRQSEDPLRP